MYRWWWCEHLFCAVVCDPSHFFEILRTQRSDSRLPKNNYWHHSTENENVTSEGASYTPQISLGRKVILHHEVPCILVPGGIPIRRSSGVGVHSSSTALAAPLVASTADEFCIDDDGIFEPFKYDMITTFHQRGLLISFGRCWIRYILLYQAFSSAQPNE